MNIPDKWINLFNKVVSQDPTAIMGGGCMRDLYHDKPVKDLDIFVSKFVYVDDRNLPFTPVSEEDYTSDFVRALYDIDGLKVDLVLPSCGTPMGRLLSFDFGLCQIGWGKDGLIMTDAFIHDSTNKCFTFLDDPTNEKALTRSTSRHARISQKYPGWPMVIPAKPHA